MWSGHFSVEGHLGCFQCLFITKDLSVDVHKQGCVCGHIFSLFQINTQEARLDGNCVLLIK